MNSASMRGSNTRSLDSGQPVDILALLRQSITDQIDQIIQQHPCCPPEISYEVDALMQTADQLVGE